MPHDEEPPVPPEAVTAVAATPVGDWIRRRYPPNDGATHYLGEGDDPGCCAGPHPACTYDAAFSEGARVERDRGRARLEAIAAEREAKPGAWLGTNLRELANDLFGEPPPGHAYLSTSCLHAAEPGRDELHAYCSSPQGRADGGETWAKRPGQCKFCGAPCMCACHQEGS